MTRIIFADDHTLVRQSLVKTVSAEEGFDVVGETGRGDDAVQLAATQRPDVAVLDVELPGGSGLQIAEEIRSGHPDIRILFLSMHGEEATVRRAIALGADGYVLKTASTDELLHALRVVADGGSYLSPVIARRVLAMAGSPGHGERLTDRELAVLQMVSEGARPAQVATKLFVSVKTVKNYLTSIYAKLGVQTCAQAVVEAYRRGLVVPEACR